uniref:Secreted protein n=1 Tax=Rhipicephalus zambeziensis TaxID=60191 RepID=A0A224YWB1_9ACAR
MNAAFFIPAVLLIGVTYFSNSIDANNDQQSIAKMSQHLDTELTNDQKSARSELLIESRRGKETRRNGKNKGKKPVRPQGIEVTVVNNHTVTNATYGKRKNKIQYSTYVGNWSSHAQCLMPCNPKDPEPCEKLTEGNCTCLSRKDYPIVGTCAVKGIPLGNNDYNMSNE